MAEKYQLQRPLSVITDKFLGYMSANEGVLRIVGLIFLKYASDLLDTSTDKDVLQTTETDSPKLLPNLPPQAHWHKLQENAEMLTIGREIDQAMAALTAENPWLQEILPQDYAHLALKLDLAEVIGLLSTISFGGNRIEQRRTLESVLDMLFSSFADRGGRGGLPITPPSITSLLVAMLIPEAGKQLYDGCLGTGGMFVKSAEFLSSQKDAGSKLTFLGQELDPTTYKLAKLNLALRGIEANIVQGDSLWEDGFSRIKVDYILANPPFNARDYNIDKNDIDKWKYGVPPTKNANYAWLQHFIDKLAPDGLAGIVLAPGSLSSEIQAEKQIRKAFIENDLIDCIVALPSQLLYSTSISTAVWIIANNKSDNKWRNRSHEVLFIDARDTGKMVSRKQRELTQHEIKKIVSTYHSWRSKSWPAEYHDIPGFSGAATTDEIKKNNYVLTPGRYIDFLEVAESEQAFTEKMQELTQQLKEQMDRASELDAQIKANLQKVGYSL